MRLIADVGNLFWQPVGVRFMFDLNVAWAE